MRLLVNGGSSEESVFWKYVTHVPRLDAILLSHASKNTLPGLKSLIRRKLEEKEEVFNILIFHLIHFISCFHHFFAFF